MEGENRGKQAHIVDKGWYYLDKTLVGGESQDCFAAIDKSTDYVMGYFSELAKVEEGAKVRDSLLYGEVFVSKDSTVLNSNIGNPDGESIVIIQGKSNIAYTTIRTNIVRRDSQVFIIDSKVELATFRVRSGTLTIRNSTVIGANPPSITTDIGQSNKFLDSGIIVDSLVYLGNNNNMSIGNFIISNSKVNLDILDERFQRSRIISNIDCMRNLNLPISLPIINNRSI
jgi:hypothetical protein|nr:MAG TPA: hypothetical protein [Caudoviricetes sp.]